MQTNHLGHFVLTRELWPLLLQAPAARVVNVSSAAYQLARLDKDDLFLSKPNAYHPWIAYGNSKLANILFTRYLATLVEQSKRNILCMSCHPGLVKTDLGRYFSCFCYLLVIVCMYPCLLTPSQGAQTQIYLAASEKLTLQNDAGGYFVNLHKENTPTTAANSRELAEWLWKESERLAGCEFVV